MAKPQRATWASPYIAVQYTDKSVDFYHKAFGFEIIEKAPAEDGSTWHAEMRYKDLLIMCGKIGQTPAMSDIESPISQYDYVENVDHFHEQAIKHGAKSISAPEDMFWGDRMCRLQDIDGYVWSFASHLGNP